MALKKRTRRILIISIILVVVVAVVIGSTTNGNEKTSVQADLAFIDNISEIVSASGRIQPRTKVDITAEVAAEIVNLYVAEGDYVEYGQKLLMLDTVQLKSDMNQSKFALEETIARKNAAAAQFEKSRQDFERQTKLHDQKLISETEYSQATYEFENAKANYDAMVAQEKIGLARLEKAMDNLAKTIINAPMSGIITYLKAEIGEIAQAQTSYTQGKRLMTISNLSAFEVEVSIDETEVGKVKLEQEVDVRIDAFQDVTFAGRVVEIGNSAMITGEGTENYSTNFQVKVSLGELTEDIKPGMSATVDIITGFSENVLLIPYASIVEREFHIDSLPEHIDKLPTDAKDSKSDDGRLRYRSRKNKNKAKFTGVFVINSGLVNFYEVSTGIADDRYIAILSELNAGDTVVSGSYQTMRKLVDGEDVVIDEASLERMNEDNSNQTETL